MLKPPLIRKLCNYVCTAISTVNNIFVIEYYTLSSINR